MAQILLEDVSKVYGGSVRAVNALSLDVADGDFMVFVGPSGCGKTTALRMVAGLEDITEGTIRIGERVVNDLPPKDRDIAMVFQNYALYPHMTVEDNLAFGLQLRKTPRAEQQRRVAEAAKMLGTRVAVLKDGELQQVDSPQNLFDYPGNLFVATFIGSPAMNLVEATLAKQDGGQGPAVSFAGYRLPLRPETVAERGLDRYLDRPLIVGVRPSDFEDAAVAGDGGDPGRPTLRAEVA